MRNLHLIIDLRASANLSRAEAGSVDRRVGADINIGIRDYIPDLRHALMAAVMVFVAVAV